MIVLLRDKFFDKTCCSPNSTLPEQLMYGAAIIGWPDRRESTNTLKNNIKKVRNLPGK